MNTMKKNKIQPVFKVINWDFNKDDLEFYDVMPYFIERWNSQKKKKYKTWNLDLKGETKDDTRMPETYDEFKKFILDEAQYNFWARCEYEVIVTGWPVQKKERKLDVYEQIKANIDVFTKLFMDYIKG